MTRTVERRQSYHEAAVRPSGPMQQGLSRLAHFNLVDEAWIPVRGPRGRRRVGLRELFASAAELEAVTHESPLVVFAVHRLLLAIMQRVVGDVGARWPALWASGNVPVAEVTEYLERWHSRFDLFDERHPFYQVANLVTTKNERVTEPLPVTVLRVDAATKNNHTLHDHRSDAAVEPMCPADVALWLITDQGFALGGGVGSKTNIFGRHPHRKHGPCVGRWCALLGFSSLADTLLLNLVSYADHTTTPALAADKPLWERDGYRPPGDVVPDGLLDYLTLPARYLRLLPNDHGMVQHVYYVSGLAIDRSLTLSPYALYRADVEVGRRALRPDRLRPLWRDSDALLTAPDPVLQQDLRPWAVRETARRELGPRLQQGDKLSVTCFGLVSDQASPLRWREERLLVPAMVLSDPARMAEVRSVLTRLDDVGRVMWTALRVVARFSIEPDGNAAAGDVARLTARLVEAAAYWQHVEESFHALLDSLQAEGSEAASRAFDSACEIACECFEKAVQATLGPPSAHLKALSLGRSRFERGVRSLTMNEGAQHGGRTGLDAMSASVVAAQ